MNWCAAALLGLISSSFSTLVSQLAAARIGRDAPVDWMVVANIPLRDGALQLEPGGLVIAAGILFHQWADFSWDLFFFGLLGRWTARLRPLMLLAIAPFWALFTSFMEWSVLVPLFPFRQPLFPLEQAYWIGFLVHFSTASLYPVFPFLRDWVANVHPSPHRRFAALWAGGAAAGMVILGGLAFFGSHDRELPWAGRDEMADRAYIRRMRAHHEQGIQLAQIAAVRAQDPHLRALARLMAAAQAGENGIFGQWWRSWFADPPEICGPDERAAMPGMLTDEEVKILRRTWGPAFDPLFIRLMSFHHAGAVHMADEEMRGSGDLRLRVMAQAIRHEQQGEIEMMRGTDGLPAVETAFRDLFTMRLAEP